jgi:hypothetical protein
LTCLCTPPHENQLFYPTFALHPEIHFFQIPGEGGCATTFRHPERCFGELRERFRAFFRKSRFWSVVLGAETDFWLQALFSTPGQRFRFPGTILSPYTGNTLKFTEIGTFPNSREFPKTPDFNVFTDLQGSASKQGFCPGIGHLPRIWRSG